MSRSSTSTISYEITELYDDFVEFNDYCAFLCDTIPLLFKASLEDQRHDHTLAGIHRYCVWLKQRAAKMEQALEQIQEKSLEPEPPFFLN